MKLLFPILLLLFSIKLSDVPVPKQGVYFKVSKVIDGDTFHAQISYSDVISVRLTGIDAPESRASQHKEVQYFGKQSSDFLKSFLTGKYVRFEYDVTKVDRYGRLLAYVYLKDGTFVNELLVRQGYAKAYTVQPNSKYASKFVAAERYARQNKLGLWK